MRRLFFGVVALSVGIASTTAVALTDDPVTTRQKLMQANASAAGLLNDMVRGEMPFNADVAEASLRTLNAVAYSYGDYFPEGSDQGDTRASPEIWSNMEEFQRILAGFRTATDEARASEPQTVEALQAALAAIGPSCQQCHEAFREEE